jgi:hypothetical protein
LGALGGVGSSLQHGQQGNPFSGLIEALGNNQGGANQIGNQNPLAGLLGAFNTGANPGHNPRTGTTVHQGLPTGG